MAFRTDFLKEINGFNSNIGPGTKIVGGEDTEVIIKTFYSGMAIRCTDKALVTHPEWRDINGEIKL